MNNLILEVNNLSFSYNESKKVLEDINFSIKENEIIGILGPNGCGKTTLFNIISGFEKNFEGSFLICEKNIKNLKYKERAKLFSYIQQKDEYQSGNYFSVFDFILQGRRPYNNFGIYGNDDKCLVNDSIQECKLDSLKDREISSLSGGEYQRCLLARALTQDTELLICDEPVSSMDIKYQKEFFELLKKIVKKKGQEKSALVSIHDINLAKKYCDKILIINKSRIIFFNQSKYLNSSLLSNVYDTEIEQINFKNKIYFDYYN